MTKSGTITAPSQRQITIIFILFVVLFGTVLRVINIGTVHSRSFDEATYTEQANTLRQNGLAGIRQLAAMYQQDTSRQHPPPTRFGYTSMVAGLMAVMGRNDEIPGAGISCAASVAGLMLTAALAWRTFSPWVAVVAALLLATFPPDLVIARRAWTDAWVAVLCYGLLFACFSLARGAKQTRTIPGFLVAGALLVLTKEVSAFFWGLCLLWLLFRLRWRARWVMFASVITGLFCLVLMFWLVGGPSVLWDFQSRYSSFHQVNPYTRDFQSGPSYLMLASFWVMSPLTFSLGLGGLIMAPRATLITDRLAAVGLSFFALITLALPLLLPGWLSVRYASPAFGPLCILAAVLLNMAYQWTRRQFSNRTTPALVLICFTALALSASRDLNYFHHWFVEKGVLDTSARMVLETGGPAFTLPPLAPTVHRQTTISANASATQLLNESLILYRQRRYEEVIVAAERALLRRPDFPEAFNNIAAANAELQRWDEAIAAAQQAVRLAPDFQLARNNLAWAMAEKAKQPK